MEQIYQEIKITLQTEVSELQKKSNQIALFRLFLIIGLLIIVYQLFKIHNYVGFAGILGGIIGFYYLVKYHEKTDAIIELKNTTLAVIDNELNCLQGNFNNYANGQEYAQATHEFSDDLDIFGQGSLFHLINRTKSKSGSNYLAKQLLAEAKQYSVLEKQAANKEIAQKTDWRLAFLGSMFTITNQESSVSDILTYIQQPPRLKFEKFIDFYAKIVYFVWILIVFSAYFISFSFAGYAFAAITLFHYYLSSVNSKPTEAYFNTIAGAGRLMEKFGSATALLAQENWESKILKETYQQLPISKLNSRNPIDDFVLILRKLDMRRNMLASLFLTIASPFQPIQLIKLRQWLIENPDFFEKIFHALGIFEVHASFATLHFNKPDWAFPNVNQNPTFSLHGIQLGHPLIRPTMAVCNDFDFNENNRLTLITGSNMSGKSTFLRTIGLNIVLAYSGSPVFAKAMNVSLGIQLICYMRIKDSIQQNASTFKAEIERIKLVLRAMNEQKNALFLIDEMLRGTNSEDKLAGSMALLEKIVQSKAYGMVATHDLRMTEIAGEYPNIVKNYYFEYATEDGELSFDYLIKEGVCKSFNASLLLQSIGLPLGLRENKPVRQNQ